MQIALHPMLVHFPIALLFASVLFDVAVKPSPATVSVKPRSGCWDWVSSVES